MRIWSTGLLAVFLTGAPSRAALSQSGGFVAVGTQLTTVNKGLGLTLDLAGGYQTKDGMIVGGQLSDLLNNTPFPDQPSAGAATRKTKMHFGGLLLGLDRAREGGWGHSIAIVVGGGDVSAFEGSKGDSFDQSWYVMAQPSFALYRQGGSRMQPRLNAGWRFVSHPNTPGTSGQLLSGPFVGMAVGYPNR